MKYILTEEEYNALKKQNDPAEAVRKYQECLRKAAAPFLMKVITTAQDAGRFSSGLNGIGPLISKEWNEMLDKIPLV